MANRKPLTFRDVLNEDLQDPKTIKKYAETEGMTFDEAKEILQALLDKSLGGEA